MSDAALPSRGSSWGVAAVAVVASLPALVVRLAPLENADLLWQVRAGEELLHGGDALTDRCARFLRGASVANHERGFELGLAWAHGLVGFRGLWWFTLVATVACFTLAARRALGGGATTTAVCVACGAAALAISARLDLRAELFSAGAVCLAIATCTERAYRSSARMLAPAAIALANPRSRCRRP